MEFHEEYTIQIRDINYGQHLDHIKLLEYLSETRVRYLKRIGYTETNIDGHGSSLIVYKLVCNYKKECFYGDIINIQLILHQESALRLIFKYVVTTKNIIVATAEITVAFLNSNHKIIKVPENLIKIKSELNIK